MSQEEASLYTAVLIVSGIVGVIIMFFFVSIIRQHRRSLNLYKQSIYTEINTLEKERSRMAADLHDEVGPVLSAIKLRLSSLELSDHEDEAELAKTNAQIDTLLRRMREISFDLMPSSLTRKGLPSAIGEFIEYCTKNSALKIEFHYEDFPLSQQQSINLYRIIQEIVHNTMRHAHASVLEIELKKEKEKMILSAKDNGTGFNYETRSKDASGLGLRNLLSRTEIIGGQMFFESKKGKGTSYTFEIPMK
ncbi:MAG: sensor histidine kinase [Flavisolibacter sp.]